MTRKADSSAQEGQLALPATPTPPSQLERMTHAQTGCMTAQRAQRPADHGLFDLNARKQGQLFD